MEQLELIPPETSRLPAPSKASPIVKWAGGKSWLVKHLAKGIWCHLERSGGRYVEPFFGGGALGLYLGLPHMIVSDACEELMEMYTLVRDDPDAVAYALSALAVRGVDEKTYYEIRDWRPDRALDRAARMIYLNKLAFNGIYRVNKEGLFNVPYAKDTYRKSAVSRGGRDSMGSLFPNKSMFKAVAKALRSSNIYASDFRDVVQLATDGDVVYADPPYDGTYASYTSDGFGVEEQRALADVLCDADRRGVCIVASNNDTDLIRELYSWAPAITPVAELRSVNSNGKGRGRVPCVLITNKPELLGT